MSNAEPNYDAYQSSFHAAFQTELYGVVDALPITPRTRILDVPCGSGFYAQRLAGRLGPDGRLTAVDASDKTLRRARDTLAGAEGVEVQRANAYALPFADATFDLVWCAQSLISLDPHRAVREMLRVARPDGLVAVLEVDEFHHVLLPWPAELEAALARAVHAACVKKYGNGEKRAPSRKLREVLSRAGTGSVRRTTHAFDRATPFDPPTTAFLTHYFAHLRALAYPHLPLRLRKVFDLETDPDERNALHRRPGVDLVCVNAVYLARPA